MALFLGKKLIADIQRLVKWGQIKGNITDQEDLKDALDAKANASDIHDASITLTQDGVVKGTFSVNQSQNATIALDGSGMSSVNWGNIGGTLSDQVDLTNALNGKVPTSRTVNSKALSSDITLDASDVSALPSSTKYAADLNLNSNVIQLKDQDGNNIGNPITIDKVPDVDNMTVSLNASDELQAIGIIDKNGGAAIPIWTGTRAQYDAISVKDAGVIYNITDDADAQPFVNIKRNIGEVVTSITPLYEYGLHLLDGSLLAGDGIYRHFVDFMAALVSDHPDLFISEADWQTAVATYGVCGKFVYDSVNNTVRLPKVSGFVEGTTDINTLGDLVEAGLPNITGYVAGNNLTTTENGSSSGALYYGGGSYTGPSVADKYYGPSVNIDASRSSSVYGNSSTVQPQTIKVLYYIVTMNGVKESVEIDVDDIFNLVDGISDEIDVISGEVANQPDSSMSNVNSTGTSKSAGWAMPSTTYSDLSWVSGQEYTAPANGWFVVSGHFAEGGWAVYNSTTLLGNSCFNNSGNQNYGKSATPVLKGQKVTTYFRGGTIDNFRFVYAKGSESEAL